MNYLVDTNVFSELIRPRPDVGVISWIREHNASLYISSVTVGELRYGIELLSESARRERLYRWLISLKGTMKGRVLSYNLSTAHVWGQLRAEWEKKGVNASKLDSQIAATAHRNGLILVTRDKTFQRLGIKVYNPFDTDDPSL